MVEKTKWWSKENYKRLTLIEFKTGLTEYGNLFHNATHWARP